VTAEATSAQLIARLRDRGADRLPHARGRTLLDHLAETAAILGRWHQPDRVQRAALIHSVYGTDRYRRRLLGDQDRRDLVALAGEEAERLAHLFSTTPRGPLLAGTLRWADDELTEADHDQLLMLHMANLAEQAAASDGSPAPWLTQLRDIAVQLLDSRSVVLPDFIASLLTLTDADERRAILAYREGDFALAAALNPVAPEPCLQMAPKDPAWADLALRRLTALGTTWDKRHTFEELLNRCQRPAAAAPPRSDARFRRYLSSLSENPRATVYPDLPSRPFHDPAGFPLAHFLEDHQAEIRAEILALEPEEYQPESERIERAGSWEVAFFYERGRRHDDICAACPTVTRALETPGHGAITTSAGLIYASRMRAGTHIAAHRGPTNLRLRCHLGIAIPEGDCAIRVGDETRRWENGRCLVFDDHFEHEAWNRTDHDRLVLIVDIWHPDLDSEEVRLLQGVHGHIQAHAERLSRYWQTNAGA
jgi:aspartate beta-hydroxylase